MKYHRNRYLFRGSGVSSRPGRRAQCIKPQGVIERASKIRSRRRNSAMQQRQWIEPESKAKCGSTNEMTAARKRKQASTAAAVAVAATECEAAAPVFLAKLQELKTETDVVTFGGSPAPGATQSEPPRHGKEPQVQARLARLRLEAPLRHRVAVTILPLLELTEEVARSLVKKTAKK